MPEERLVGSFDGTRLYTASEGQGPPLVFCDGLGCDGFIWKYLRRALRAEYRLIFWHYRGHGKSGPPVHPEAIGIAALKADLHAVFDAYGLDRAVVLGHSMGAQVVLDFTLTYQERVRGVISLCGSFGRPLDWLHGSPTLGRLFPLLRDGMQAYPAQGRKLWQWFFRHRWSFEAAHRFEVNAEELLPSDFKPYFEHLSVMDPLTFVRLVDRLQEHSVEDRLGQLRVPLLVVAGERDTFCPAHLSVKTHRKVKGSELLLIDDASHVAPLERPDAIEARVRQFLRRCHADAT